MGPVVTFIWPFVGWIGNIFIIIGLWKAGDKSRNAFIFSVIGEVIWVAYALYCNMYDLAFVCVIFGLIAVRNFLKWRKEKA